MSKGDTDLLYQLLMHGSCTAFELMERLGKIYVQYVQLRLRVLIHLGIVIRTDRGIYEITPEFKEELAKILKEIGYETEKT